MSHEENTVTVYVSISLSMEEFRALEAEADAISRARTVNFHLYKIVRDHLDCAEREQVEF